jgi:hypothetical protein
MNKHNKLKEAVIGMTRDDWQRDEMLGLIDDAVILGKHNGVSEIKARRAHKERMHEISMLSAVTPLHKQFIVLIRAEIGGSRYDELEAISKKSIT